MICNLIQVLVMFEAEPTVNIRAVNFDVSFRTVYERHFWIERFVFLIHVRPKDVRIGVGLATVHTNHAILRQLERVNGGIFHYILGVPFRDVIRVILLL